MPIYLIDKIQQKNDGDFFLVDAEDVEYNGKSIIDALKAGEIVQAGGSVFHVANAVIAPGGTVSNSVLTPSNVRAGDLIVDTSGNFYTVTSVDEQGVVSVGEALKAGDGTPLSFRGPKGEGVFVTNVKVGGN